MCGAVLGSCSQTANYKRDHPHRRIALILPELKLSILCKAQAFCICSRRNIYLWITRLEDKTFQHEVEQDESLNYLLRDTIALTTSTWAPVLSISIAAADVSRSTWAPRCARSNSKANASTGR